MAHRLPLALAVLFAPAGLASQSPQSQVPDGLRELVFGARKQRKTDVRIADVAFRAIPSRGDLPLLAWPLDPSQLPDVAFDKAAVATWLSGAAETLGLSGFAPRFLSEGDFRGLTEWRYEFVRKDVKLLDHWVSVYWNGKTFAGLFHHFPAPITSVDEPQDGDKNNPNRVYFAQRDEAHRFRLVIATLSRRETPSHMLTSVVTRRGVEYVLSEQKADYAAPAGAATFSEHAVPQGTFPDQIWADSAGLIWFSQPSNNLVTSFDPKVNQFRQYPTTGGSGPDGLWVDDKDRVWTGLYYSSHLGFLDVATKTFTSIAPPYSPANLAIPSPSSRGTVWVTDHARNRISEYDPTAKSWVGSHPMPIANTWVVAGTLDPVRERVYFTGYSSNTLPYKDIGQGIQDIPVPSRGGPAFLAYHDDKVYFSLWSSNRLGEYDVSTNLVTEYAYRTDVGGPMSITPAGQPVIGTRNVGYIVVFDPVSKTFTDHRIPTSTGLKDGLTVAPDGAIWFTGTYSNRIARLVLK